MEIVIGVLRSYFFFFPLSSPSEASDRAFCKVAHSADVLLNIADIDTRAYVLLRFY